MNPTRARSAGMTGILVTGLLFATLSVSGCNSLRQTEVTTSTPGQSETTATMTPLEKGKVRREALKTARAGLDAFLTDDATAMRSTFATQYSDYWAKVRKETAAEGRKRVRKHQLQSLDVTLLSDDAKQALVEYYFIDQSYYTDLGGTPVTKPNTGKAAEEMFQLTLDKKGDVWVVTRMIGDEPVMK